MITVSKRMETVISMVTKGNRVADIGTDHGYVPIALVQRKWIKKAIAMDVRKGPLQKAMDNIQAYHMDEQIETRLSDGMEKLEAGEADTIIIAGMGGELMARILRDGARVLDSVQEVIVQPQSEIYKVRMQLHQMGFQIVEEKMLIDEGKYYTAMKAIKGKECCDNEVQYYFGKLLLEQKDQVLYEWLQKEYATSEALYQKLKDINSEAGLARREQLLHILELLKGGLSYYEA